MKEIHMLSNLRVLNQNYLMEERITSDIPEKLDDQQSKLLCGIFGKISENLID